VARHHLKERTTYSADARPYLISAFFVALGLVRALGGALLRPDRVRGAIVVSALGTAAIGLAGLHVDAALLPLAGFTAGLLFPACVFELTTRLLPEDHGRAIGIVSGTYSFALALSHATVGLIADRAHLGVALHVSPLCALIGIAVLVAFSPSKNRSPS
jgi:predicted MFS family arabinose efflux permease